MIHAIFLHACHHYSIHINICLFSYVESILLSCGYYCFLSISSPQKSPLIYSSKNFLKFSNYSENIGEYKFFGFLATLHSMWELSSPSGDRTHVPCSESPEPQQPGTTREVPNLLFPSLFSPYHLFLVI